MISSVFKSTEIKPENLRLLEEIREKASELLEKISLVQTDVNLTEDPSVHVEIIRGVSIAKTHLETSVMFAVKALSRA